MLSPPVLPHFLSAAFNLKEIEGVPSDGEVKLIHATIRALNEVVTIPGLYDPDVAVELSEYLFSVQMERYRNKYPCTIFPSSTTYTPPQLPSHIPVSLSPIIDAPSNNEMKSVQTALRMLETLANVPSMFDADLNMNLSQHLFDIQFGRYLSKVTNRDHGQAARPSGAGVDINDPQGAHHADEARVENAQNQGHHNQSAAQSSDHVEPSSEVPALRSEIASLQSEISTLKDSVDGARGLKTEMENMGHLLSRLCDSTDNVRQTLVGTQHCMARGINAAVRGYDKTAYMNYSHSLINSKGETPESIGLPSMSSLMLHMGNWGEDKDPDLARYLRFYGIGEEVIQEEPRLTIKDGSRDKAKSILRTHLGFYSEYRHV